MTETPVNLLLFNNLQYIIKHVQSCKNNTDILFFTHMLEQC